MNAPKTRFATDPERRFRRAWEEDGISQLVFGLGLMIWGGLDLGGLRIWRSAFTLLLILGGPWLVGKAKSRITDARTGYVRPRRRRGDDLALDMLLGIVAGFLIIGVAILVLLLDQPNGLLAVLLISVAGAAPLIGWRLTSDRRYLAHSLASLGSAMIAWRFAVGLHVFGLYVLLFGAALLVSGSLTLRSYLRRHPVPVVA